VVRTAAVPCAETRGAQGGGEFVGRVVLVEEGEEVGREGGAVGLGEAREGEGAGDEEAGGGGGGRGRLMGVQRAAVEAGRAELVSRGGSEGWRWREDGGGVRNVPAGWETGLASFSALDGVEGLDLCGRRGGSVMG